MSQPKDIDALMATNLDSGSSIEETRKNLIAKIGENVSVRRFSSITENDGENIGSYQHGERIAVLVSLKGGEKKIKKKNN
ncbi:Translation elongation factor Ts [hydrothermal vent metagenome]|uniref:Translation elongation factor Ts n=1 Tax=hydrothermal vent metagenome TaxID=652676 RepID=A0A1W1C1I9_9ZZZZ